VAGPLQPVDQVPPVLATEVRTAGLAAMETVLLDWQQAPFDDVDARQAFCLAINRDGIAASDRENASATTPTWHLLPPELPGYNPALTGPDGVTATSGDLAKARAHWAAYLARGGTKTGAPLQLHAALKDPLIAAHAGALAAQWNAAFGPATVALTDAGQTHSTVGPNDPPPAWLDAALLIWRPDLASPRALVSQLIQSTVATHDLPADLARVLAQLAQADAGGGGDDPQALYQRAEQALIAGAYICPVGQPVARYLVRPTVRGYVVDALGAVPLDAWVEMSVAAS
jgi:peptide/nickel transport system substrate-binding protein/oligopeptide transport system substrate-binding protein